MALAFTSCVSTCKGKPTIKSAFNFFVSFKIVFKAFKALSSKSGFKNKSPQVTPVMESSGVIIICAPCLTASFVNLIIFFAFVLVSAKQTFGQIAEICIFFFIIII